MIDPTESAGPFDFGDYPEEWRAVPGWEGVYEVSSHGRVRSLERVIRRKDGTTLRVRAKLMTTFEGDDRYWFVTLRNGGGVKKAERVHRMVYAAFVAERVLLATEEVDHVGREKWDNRPCSLDLVTPEENKRRRIAIEAREREIRERETERMMRVRR